MTWIIKILAEKKSVIFYSLLKEWEKTNFPPLIVFNIQFDRFYSNFKKESIILHAGKFVNVDINS